MAVSVPDWAADVWQYDLATETVTLLVKVADGAAVPTPVTVANAKRRAEMRTAPGELGLRQLTWHLWQANLGGTVPKRHDQIRDAAGVTYSVDSVEVASLGQRFRLVTTEVRP